METKESTECAKVCGITDSVDNITDDKDNTEYEVVHSNSSEEPTSFDAVDAEETHISKSAQLRNTANPIIDLAQLSLSVGLTIDDKQILEKNSDTNNADKPGLVVDNLMTFTAQDNYRLEKSLQGMNKSDQEAEKLTKETAAKETKIEIVKMTRKSFGDAVNEINEAINHKCLPEALQMIKTRKITKGPRINKKKASNEQHVQDQLNPPQDSEKKEATGKPIKTKTPQKEEEVKEKEEADKDSALGQKGKKKAKKAKKEGSDELKKQDEAGIKANLTPLTKYDNNMIIEASMSIFKQTFDASSEGTSKKESKVDSTQKTSPHKKQSELSANIALSITQTDTKMKGFENSGDLSQKSKGIDTQSEHRNSVQTSKCQLNKTESEVFENTKRKAIEIASLQPCNCEEVSRFIIKSSCTLETPLKIYIKLCELFASHQKLCSFDHKSLVNRKSNHFKSQFIEQLQNAFEDESGYALGFNKSVSEMTSSEKSAYISFRNTRLMRLASLTERLYLLSFIDINHIEIIIATLGQKFIEEYKTRVKAIALGHCEESHKKANRDNLSLEGLLDDYCNILKMVQIQRRISTLTTKLIAIRVKN